MHGGISFQVYGFRPFFHETPKLQPSPPYELCLITEEPEELAVSVLEPQCSPTAVVCLGSRRTAILILDLFILGMELHVSLLFAIYPLMKHPEAEAITPLMVVACKKNYNCEPHPFLPFPWVGSSPWNSKSPSSWSCPVKRFSRKAVLWRSWPRPRTALLFLQQRLPGQSRYRHGFKIMHDGFQMFWDAQVAVQIQIYGTWWNTLQTRRFAMGSFFQLMFIYINLYTSFLPVLCQEVCFKAALLSALTTFPGFKMQWKNRGVNQNCHTYWNTWRIPEMIWDENLEVGLKRLALCFPGSCQQYHLHVHLLTLNA